MLVEVIERMRIKHLSPITQKEYINWMKRFIRFNDLKHPATCSEREVEGFLSHLAIEGEVSASTQNQALAAIVFLYKECLGIPLEGIDSLRAKKTDYVPVVFSREEIERLFSFLDSSQRLKFELLYGCGLRLNELITLRVKDIDLEKKIVTVFKTKGISIVLIALHKGAEMIKHTAEGLISVQVLKGKIMFNTDNESVELTKGQILVLHEGISHSVLARKKTFFLLTVTTALAEK